MFKKILLASLFATQMAYAQSPSWPNPNKPQGLRYTFSQETIDYANSGTSTMHRWLGVRYQGLSGSIRDDRQGSRLRLNSSLGEMVSLDSLKKFQVEIGYESPSLLYGILGYEIPVYSPVTFFLASAHRPGGDQNFLGGPVLYWGNHNLQILYYGTQMRGSKVKQSISMRQNLRFTNFWATAELIWRDTQDKTYNPWGYGFGVGFKHVYARASLSPYWEGLSQKRSFLEIGLETGL